MSPIRRFFDGLSLVLITALALGGPLAIGFFAWLALGDGLDINPGDPLRAGRIWLIRENRRFTALAVSSVGSAAPQNAADGVQCARTYFTALRWSPSLSLDRNTGTCSCYAVVDGRLRQSTTLCAEE